MSYILDKMYGITYYRGMDEVTVANRPNPATAADRRYKIEFWTAMTAYVVVLFVSVWLVKRVPENPWHTIIALLPAIPIVFVFVAMVHYMAATDELERQIKFESLALAAGITALASVTYGFLELAGFPPLSAWFTYLTVMISWAIATPFVARKYK
ncbi:MAG: hypothetical protein M3N19_09220 [Candidatus Eremiobacteraeota bacterium]|nr:hypothetical protein [Candidatus Eremiobacteraeota bacterium]